MKGWVMSLSTSHLKFGTSSNRVKLSKCLVCDCYSITLHGFVVAIEVYITSESFHEDDIYKIRFVHAFSKSKYS